MFFIEICKINILLTKKHSIFHKVIHDLIASNVKNSKIITNVMQTSQLLIFYTGSKSYRLSWLQDFICHLPSPRSPPHPTPPLPSPPLPSPSLPLPSPSLPFPSPSLPSPPLPLQTELALGSAATRRLRQTFIVRLFGRRVRRRA